VVAFLTTLPRFPIAWRGFHPDPGVSHDALLAHRIAVLEREHERLHNLFIDVRDSRDDIGAMTGEDWLKNTVEVIVVNEIGHDRALLRRFYDDTGFNQPQRRTPRITETANQIERRYIRLGEVLQELRGRR
jgi:hypothetical protein